MKNITKTNNQRQVTHTRKTETPNGHQKGHHHGKCPKNNIIHCNNIVLLRNQIIFLASFLLIMSASTEKEINRRLTLLPTVLQSLDHQIKVALVQNDYIELDSFPIDKDGWETLEADCNINSNGILNTVKNPITFLQNQQTRPEGK